MNGYALWLYGSDARGDSSSSSDVDILVVSDSIMPIEFSSLFPGRRLSVSQYNWSEIDRMAQYGSLFLHHLRLEGKVLNESLDVKGRLQGILDKLPTYLRANRDVRAFRQTLVDIAAELPNPPDLLFELATLAALIRRIAILGCYLLGSPEFGRTQPLIRLSEAWKLPRRFASEFPQLYRYRLAAEVPGTPRPPAYADTLKLWIDRTRLLLDKLEVQAHEFSETLSH
jgi:predicted nucleotidyltransferase